MKKNSIIIVGLLVTAIVGYYFLRSSDSLDAIIKQAKKTHTDALVINKDGANIVEWYANGVPEKIQTMSISKSIVSLAIGLLIAQGKITSIDQPVYEYYPEWNQGEKKLITIRHILNHTSGIHDLDNAMMEIVPSKDVIKLALAAPQVSAPGTAFFYNNKAVNLLAGIIEKASGQRMDIYIAENVFKPLGITDFVWQLDPSGTPYAMAGLEILPTDLVKIGQLILNNGIWQGKQIIDPEWLKLSFTQSQKFNTHCGLLWWTIWDEKKHQSCGYKGQGYLGQYLVIYPEQKIIGVRLIKQLSSKDRKVDDFDSFPEMIRNIK